MTEKHSYEIIVLDLDGTLTNRDKGDYAKDEAASDGASGARKEDCTGVRASDAGGAAACESWSWQNTAVIFCRLMEAGSRTAKPARSYSAVPAAGGESEDYTPGRGGTGGAFELR